jgi:hypothetical protein
MRVGQSEIIDVHVPSALVMHRDINQLNYY